MTEPGSRPDTEGAPGLSAEQRAELDRARAALRPIQRAARWSTVTLWTVGGFGALTVLWGLVAGAGGVVVGVALLAVAWNERRGRDRLRGLNPAGARILGWNQIILAVVITVYLGLVIYRARTTVDPSMQELQTMVGLDPELVADLTTLVYGIVIVVVDVTQALLAGFHFRREAMAESLRKTAPEWALDVLGGGA